MILTFLEIDGARVDATDRELAAWIIAFSAATSPHEVAEATRQRCIGSLAGRWRAVQWVGVLACPL